MCEDPCTGLKRLSVACGGNPCNLIHFPSSCQCELDRTRVRVVAFAVGAVVMVLVAIAGYCIHWRRARGRQHENLPLLTQSEQCEGTADRDEVERSAVAASYDEGTCIQSINRDSESGALDKAPLPIPA